LPRGAQIIITPWLFHLFSRHYAIIFGFATLSSPFIIAADTLHIDTPYAMIAFDITFTITLRHCLSCCRALLLLSPLPIIDFLRRG
jgi:hypothetical protein